MSKGSFNFDYEGRLRKHPNEFWQFDYPDLPGAYGIGAKQDEAIHNAQTAAERWLRDAIDAGTAPPEKGAYNAYSGALRLRLPKSLRHEVDDVAQGLGISRASLIRTLVEFGLSKMFAPDEQTLNAIVDAERSSFNQCPVDRRHQWPKVQQRSKSPERADWLIRFDPATHYHLMVLSEAEEVSANMLLVSLISKQMTSVHDYFPQRHASYGRSLVQAA